MGTDDAKAEPFRSLVELFRPHVAAVKMPKMLKWARSPHDLEEKKTIFLSLLLLPFRLGLRAAGQEGKHLQSVATTFAEAHRAFFSQPRFSRKQVDTNKEKWLDQSATTFVRGWLSVLHSVESRWSDTLKIGPLDDVMLPQHSHVDSIGRIQASGHEDLSGDEIRSILRAVRATLPPGQDLPHQVEDIFMAERRLFD